MKITLAGTLLWLSLAGVSATLPPSPARAAPKRPKPDLRLRVSSHAGTRPLGITLTGSLLQVDPAEIESCVVRVDWSYLQPRTTMPLMRRRDIPCAERYAKGEIPTSFSKDLTLQNPGTYSYRIILKPKTGRQIASISQEVEVRLARDDSGGLYEEED